MISPFLLAIGRRVKEGKKEKRIFLFSIITILMAEALSIGFLMVSFDILLGIN